MTQNHTKFLKHLKESKPAVWAIAQWLSERGYPVKVNPSPIADEHKNWKSYVDNGDIEITQRVEIKEISQTFTSAKDWPIKDKFIVCAKHSFDRATPKPFAYIILSKDRNHAAIVMGSTYEYWYIEKRQDSRYENVSQEFYFCPLEHIKFVRIGTTNEQEKPHD